MSEISRREAEESRAEHTESRAVGTLSATQKCQDIVIQQMAERILHRPVTRHCFVCV